jgi:predicted dithiol-disulfide oxidoreductase (DUF899 family)
MTEHTVGTREEWQAARDELLEREKEHTHLGDDLARQRRELPWVRIDKEHSFETAEGTKTLPGLFEGCSQLLMYHFMFGPEYEAGCPTCSAIADNTDANVVHLRARDVTMICASARQSTGSRRTGGAWDGASAGCPQPATTSTSTSGLRTPTRWLIPYSGGGGRSREGT